LRLKAPKPNFPKYPKELKTLGDHIRKRRLDLGLVKRQVAERIGVSEATIYNWGTQRNLAADSPAAKSHPVLGIQSVAASSIIRRQAPADPEATWSHSKGNGETVMD